MLGILTLNSHFSISPYFFHRFAQDSPGLQAVPAVLDTFAPRRLHKRNIVCAAIRIARTTNSSHHDAYSPTFPHITLPGPLRPCSTPAPHSSIAAELARTRQLHCIRFLLHPRDTHHPPTMCVICETIYVCGDKDSQTVQCNDTKSPTHETRILTTNNPDVCNRPNCRNPHAIPA